MDDSKLNQFYAGLADIEQMQPDEFALDTKLESLKYGWDSLAWMSTSALVEDVFGKRVDTRQLAACKTIGEIMRLAGEMP